MIKSDNYPEIFRDLASLAQVDPELIAGQKLYTNNCATCHGSVASSAKKGRSLALIIDAINTIPQMAVMKGLTSEDLRLIAKALNPTLPTTTENGHTIFGCDMSQVAKTPATKLTNREFKNALLGLLEDISPALSADAELNILLNSLPPDTVKVTRFSAQEQNFLLTSLAMTGYFNAAFKAGGLAASANLSAYPNTGSCLASATVTQACHQSFVRELASHAFRRTINATDGNIIAAGLWDNSLSKTDLIQLTFTSIAQMPDFMYRTYDHGGVSNRGTRILSMTAEELASKLSFFLTGKSPDASLKALALSGAILNKTTLASEVDRLMATPEAQETVRRFFREAYGYDRFESFSYSDQFLTGLSTANLTTAMTQEMDNYFTDIVLTRGGTFRDMLTSVSSNIPSPQLAALYGSASTGVTNLPAERAGFLNRAAFLARISGNYTSPVKRGLMVLENVLCEKIGDPPPNAPTSVPETMAGQNQYQSTRERYTHLSEVPGTSCILCHSRMNNLGYPFEKFDSIGRTRAVEQIFTSSTSAPIATVNINTASTIPDLRVTPTAIANSTDLAMNLGSNDKAMMCLVKQLKNFQARSPAAAADGCQMNTSLRTLYGTGGNQGSIKNAIKDLILSDDFKLWSY